MIKERIKILKQFDDYLRKNADEDAFIYWLMMGVPDCCDESMYRFIASDEECWLNCVEAFAECCKMMGVI